MKKLWMLCAGALLATAGIATTTGGSPVQAAGSANTAVWVGAPFRGTYARTGIPSTLPGRHTPVYTVTGFTYQGDWAMDYYGPAGTAVRVYAAPKNTALNGGITARVLTVRPACGSGVIANGGYVVIVGIFDRGVRIGSVTYAHVNPSVSTGQTISRWGGQVGVVGKYTNNSCWQVSTSAGQHTHLEMSNISGWSCYRNLGAGSVTAAGEYIGYLGGVRGQWTTGRNQPCPNGI